MTDHPQTAEQEAEAKATAERWFPGQPEAQAIFLAQRRAPRGEMTKELRALTDPQRHLKARIAVLEAEVEHLSRPASEQPVEAIGAGRVLVPLDTGPNFFDSSLPYEMIMAGADAIDQATDDMANYVSGDTTDWDSGMMAVAVYRAMVAAALSPASPARLRPIPSHPDGKLGVPASPARSPMGEPVAWIERQNDGTRYGEPKRWPPSDRARSYAQEMGRTIEPLYAAASPAPTPMGEEALREALECVEDYDHTGRLAGVLRQAIDGAVRIDHLTPDQQSDIRAHITGLSDPEEDTYQAPEHGWTCFHCGATFKTTRGARMHFGHNVTGRPKCHDPERLVEIYDGAQAAVAAASPARADFEVRVARRDEARNAIIAALAAPTPMGGEVEALREAAKREEVARIVELAIVRHGVEETALEGTLRDADAILKALAASSPSPAQGGIDYSTLADLHTIKGWLHGLSTHPDLEDVVADGGVTAGMVYQQEAREFAGRIGRILAAPPSVQPVEGK